MQVKTRVAGRAHTLTVRDVKLSEAGEVKLTAKDFQTQAQLIIRGQTLEHTTDSECITPSEQEMLVSFWLIPDKPLCFCVQSRQWSSQSLWRTRRWRRKPPPRWSVKFPERTQRYDGSERDRKSERPRSMTLSSMDARERWSSTTALPTTQRCTPVTPKSSRLPVSWRSHVRTNVFLLFYSYYLVLCQSWDQFKIIKIMQRCFFNFKTESTSAMK